MYSKNNITLSIVTPQGVEYQGLQSQYKFYGEKGFLEVLPNHQNYMSTLKRSVVFGYKNESFHPIVLIDHGILFFQHKNNNCTIITHFAINLKYYKKSSYIFKNSIHPFFKFVKLFIQNNNTLL